MTAMTGGAGRLNDFIGQKLKLLNQVCQSKVVDRPIGLKQRNVIIRLCDQLMEMQFACLVILSA
jgi:hypothetical protein